MYLRGWTRVSFHPTLAQTLLETLEPKCPDGAEVLFMGGAEVPWELFFAVVAVAGFWF